MSISINSNSEMLNVDNKPKPKVKDLLDISNTIFCINNIKNYIFTDQAEYIHVITPNTEPIRINAIAYRLLIGRKLEEISIYRAFPGHIYLIEDPSNNEYEQFLIYLHTCYKKCINTILSSFITELQTLKSILELNDKNDKINKLIKFYFNELSYLNCYHFIINILYHIKCIDSCSTEIIELRSIDTTPLKIDENELFDKINGMDNIAPESNCIYTILDILIALNTETWLMLDGDILLPTHISNRYSMINSHSIHYINTLISIFDKLDKYVCFLCFGKNIRKQI
jgi:hypothetical protein